MNVDGVNMTATETIHLVDAEELTRNLLVELGERMPREISAAAGRWVREIAPHGWEGSQHLGDGPRCGRIDYRLNPDGSIRLMVADGNYAPIWNVTLRPAEQLPSCALGHPIQL